MIQPFVSGYELANFSHYKEMGNGVAKVGKEGSCGANEIPNDEAGNAVKEGKCGEAKYGVNKGKWRSGEAVVPDLSLTGTGVLLEPAAQLG